MANYIKILKDDNEKLKQDNERLQKELEEAKAKAAAAPASLAQATHPLGDGPMPGPVAAPPTQSKLSGRTPTKPWNSKDNVSRPYRRDYFALKSKNPGFWPRFVSPENVESRLARGYRIADPKDYGGLTDTVIDDGSHLGNRIVRRGMILMEKPLADVQAEEATSEARRKAQRRNDKQKVLAEAREIEKEMGPDYSVPVTDEGRAA